MKKDKINALKNYIISCEGEEGINMNLPILIAKKEGMKICPDDYKIGWLMKDDSQGLWMTWGSCKNFKTAMDCARDTIKEKGEREVYTASVPLPKNLTLEQILNLENITASFK